MKYSGDKSMLLPGYDYLNLQLKRLDKKLGAACEAKDVEGVHQSRVACRRLLEGMEFYKDFFDERKYKLWRKNVRHLLKAMGKARDLDVQILFLQEKIARLYEDQVRIRAGLNDLLLKRKRAREEYQSELVREIKLAGEEGYLKDIRKVLKKLVKANFSRLSGSVSAGGLEYMHGRIDDKVKELCDCEECLERVEDKHSLHDMRIKAKKLRYTMEISDEVLGGTLKSFIKKVKGVQDMLGVIHDCDVWEESLVNLLRKESDKVSFDPRYAYMMGKIMPGQEYLLEEQRQLRNGKFDEFKKSWMELKEQGFWHSLEDIFGMLGEKDVEMHFV